MIDLAVQYLLVLVKFFFVLDIISVTQSSLDYE